MVSVVASSFTPIQTTLSSSISVPLEQYGEQNRSGSFLNGRCRKMSFSEDSNFAQNMVYTHIINALEAYHQGHRTAYENLRKQFSCDPQSVDAPSSVQLKRLLFSLIHVASRLDSTYQSLIDDILKMHWVEKDDEFVSVYIQFLGTIASAHSGYIPLIIKMLIQLIASASQTVISLPNETPVTSTLIYDRIHSALKHILDLVPVSYTFLFSVLATEFPHKSHKTSFQVAYLKNLLKILEYAPVISGQVLGLIMDKIIQIDVEIQIELDDLDEESDELDAILTNEMDNCSKDKLLSHDNVNSDIDTEHDENEESLDVSENQYYLQAITYIKDMVNKLDCMLTVLFEYLATIFTPSKESNGKSDPFIDIVFDHLLHIFDSIILHTFRSRYTQFIFFWTSQINEKYTNMFLELILERTFDTSRSQISRSISCSYVASFIARAATLSKAMVRHAINTLCRWTNVFLDEWENTDDTSEVFVKKFNVFYAVVQSILYIFCFRWRDLTDDEAQDGLGWLKSLLILQRAILSRLNPLKYCSPNIVSQFAATAHQLNFFYCYPIIEQNKRLANIYSAFHSVHTPSTAPALLSIDLETYFPFDPYHLKLSRRFIDPLYIVWTALPSSDTVEGLQGLENTDLAQDSVKPS